MYRAALRSSPSALRALRPANVVSGSRRFLSTAPAQRKGTWKGAGLRWGLAIAAVYFYNTSPIFADELPPQSRPAPSSFSDADLPTVDAIIEEKRKQTVVKAPLPPAEEQVPEPAEKSQIAETEAAPIAAPEAGSPEALEQEAESQGAFNPETGEINWDCPCLGGMAHGPCGEEFKAAFSCFVYSKEEPKGMDCIDKFQHMQDCFRKYPEIYGSEIADDEDDAPAPAQDAALAKDASEVSVPTEKTAAVPEATATPRESLPISKVEDPVQKLKEDHGVAPEEAVPTKIHDATDANKSKEVFHDYNHEPIDQHLLNQSSARSESPMSYAEVASKGPKQTPEEAAAPQPPQVVTSTSASTSSLIDVDTPSVRTVPSNFDEQEVQTETQAARREREVAEEKAEQAASKARAEADLAKKKAKAKARKADGWLNKQFEGMSDGASGALVAANFIAVVGLSGWLGYKAWGLYDHGKLGWKNVGLGLGILGAVGAVEGVMGRYLYKAKGKDQ
ncbi:mitochondrial intermembrane space import and assembly protein 40 [Echria macrotheca]|uniref:Mitochondrial intermembrane space import and assembly protein 40 n=1 Tax=Echria macrotheca TaxID=438768 RepID=A0AAJ0BKK6_9PEZI|nr:mitochondrial intermembrane space import and assembly protein 40 [Echria macrotheca]